MQWEGADEVGATGEVEGLGRDEKFDWICSDVHAQKNIEILQCVAFS
jgi:hypothetical protein